jgi:hypothetical protein
MESTQPVDSSANIYTFLNVWLVNKLISDQIFFYECLYKQTTTSNATKLSVVVVTFPTPGWKPLSAYVSTAAARCVITVLGVSLWSYGICWSRSVGKFISYLMMLAGGVSTVSYHIHVTCYRHSLSAGRIGTPWPGARGQRPSLAITW